MWDVSPSKSGGAAYFALFANAPTHRRISFPPVRPPVRLSQMARLASGSVNEKDVRAAVAALHAIINNAGAPR